MDRLNEYTEQWNQYFPNCLAVTNRSGINMCRNYKKNNNTITQSTKYCPFELMTGVKHTESDIQDVKWFLEEEYTECILEECETMTEEATKNILQIQEENKV